MTPDNVKSYVNAGHDVYIEKGAGEGSGFLDAEYEAAGAKMIDTAKEVWDTVEMMIQCHIGRCHPLINNRKGQYAVDLVHPYRLVFEKQGTEIQIAHIMEIVDYH